MKENNKQNKININQSNKQINNNLNNYNQNNSNNKENNQLQPQNLANSTNSINKSSIFEEAAKKLKILEKGQKEAERYFKARDANENKLKLLESNIKKKILLEKKANNAFDEKTLEKISEILKKISELDISILKNFEQPKKNNETQTDEEDIKVLNDKVNKLEKENENLRTKKIKFKSEIEVLKNEVSNLQNINEKQGKELKILQTNFEEVSSKRSDIEIKLKELTRYNENLVENVKKHDKLIKEYNELKTAMEESIKLEREKYDYLENKRSNIYNEFKSNFMCIPQMDILNEITVFLLSKDIGNLMVSCKNVYYSFKNNKECIRNYFVGVISQYKNKLNKLANFDLKNEYNLNDSETERLFKE
jgi:chromosome segregation ATPase